MRQAFASLTSRLVLTAVALVLTVSVLIGAGATFAMHGRLTDQLDDQIQQTLSTLAEPGSRSLGNYRPGTVIGVFPDENSPDPTGDRGVIFQPGRSRTAPLDPEVLDQVTQVQDDGRYHEADLEGLGHYRLRAGDVPGGTYVVGLPTDDVSDAVRSQIGYEVVLILLGAIVAAGAGTYVVRRQLRPLREVASTAHTVAALPLAEGEIAIAPRVPEHLTDARTEVGQVGSALNTLLVHVESSLAHRHRSEQQVRQFVADASHELRTPLTTIAGYTELARRRPDDDGAMRTALGKVEEESARMTSMVEDLLLLARLDAGRPLARDSVNLSRLLVEAVSDARVVAPDHRWRLELPEESIEVTGDAERLHQVVTNLLTNARKHTPPGTTVTVTGTLEGRGAGFSVHDDGPGFPPDLAATAFERFVRGDTSRTRANADGTVPDSGGAGLGLSLVEAIVTAHGGSVTLDTHPGSTTVTVALPG